MIQADHLAGAVRSLQLAVDEYSLAGDDVLRDRVDGEPAVVQRCRTREAAYREE